MSAHYRNTTGNNATRKYNKYLECDVETTVMSDCVRKSYYGLAVSHWERILTASMVLGAAHITPKIIQVKVEKARRYIDYTRLEAFDNDEVPLPLANVPISTIINEIVHKVDQMHDYGYGHGDLHIFNIACDNTGVVYFLDLDTVYHIHNLNDSTESIPTWLQLWIDERYDGDIEAFANADYDSWRSDWLD